MNIGPIEGGSNNNPSDDSQNSLQGSAQGHTFKILKENQSDSKNDKEVSKTPIKVKDASKTPIEHTTNLFSITSQDEKSTREIRGDFLNETEGTEGNCENEIAKTATDVKSTLVSLRKNENSTNPFTLPDNSAESPWGKYPDEEDELLNNSQNNETLSANSPNPSTQKIDQTANEESEPSIDEQEFSFDEEQSVDHSEETDSNEKAFTQQNADAGQAAQKNLAKGAEIDSAQVNAVSEKIAKESRKVVKAAAKACIVSEEFAVKTQIDTETQAINTETQAINTETQAINTKDLSIITKDQILYDKYSNFIERFSEENDLRCNDSAFMPTELTRELEILGREPTEKELHRIMSRIIIKGAGLGIITKKDGSRLTEDELKVILIKFDTAFKVFYEREIVPFIQPQNEIKLEKHDLSKFKIYDISDILTHYEPSRDKSKKSDGFITVSYFISNSSKKQLMELNNAFSLEEAKKREKEEKLKELKIEIINKEILQYEIKKARERHDIREVEQLSHEIKNRPIEVY